MTDTPSHLKGAAVVTAQDRIDLASMRLQSDADFSATVAALRAELASYRALPVVPKSDYDRLLQALDDALDGHRAFSSVATSESTIGKVLRDRYAREARQWQHNHDQRKAERDCEISAHDWTKQKLADAERANDALTRELANLRDSRSTVTASLALDHLQAVLKTLAGSAGSPSEVGVWNAARAFCAEQGRVAPEVDEAKRAWAEREARNG